MNILLTIHHERNPHAGASGAVIALAEALRALGHRVDVLSHDDLPAFAKGKKAILTFPLLVGWRAFRWRSQYEVVDFASSDGWIAVLLPRRFRPRVLAFHSHGLEHIAHLRMVEDRKRNNNRLSWKYWLFRGTILLRQVAIALHRADVAFLLNHAELIYSTKSLCLRPDRGYLCYHGLPNTLIDLIPSPAPSAADPLQIAFVGGFIPVKGVAYLVPALEAHLRRFPRSSALLLGTGSTEQAIRERFTNDVRSQIRVVPRYVKSELPRLLADRQILVMPSLSEGFGMAALEAMSCGLVPVVSRGHGFDEFVRDGENGLLIDRGSAESIVQALLDLELHRGKWEKMRLQANKTAQAFTWARAATTRTTAYAAALSEWQHSRRSANEALRA